MHFMVRNPKTGIFTHCGVLEFTASEGRCYLPLWMMRRIGAADGEAVQVAYTKLPLGRGVRLQPCTRDFLDISDHRAVLEVMMTAYAALTVGDVFQFHYNRRDYFIEVRDVQPHNKQNAISIVETNLAIEFDPPKDMPPEEHRPAVPGVAEAAAAAAVPATVEPAAADGVKKKKGKKKKVQKRKRESTGGDSAAPAAASAHDGGHSFVAFSGAGHSLSAPAPRDPLPDAPSDPWPAAAVPRHDAQPPQPAQPAVAAAPAPRHADSGTTFVPYSGASHTLSGRTPRKAPSSTPAAAPTATAATQPMFGRSEYPTAPERPRAFVPFGGQGHRLG